MKGLDPRTGGGLTLDGCAWARTFFFVLGGRAERGKCELHSGCLKVGMKDSFFESFYFLSKAEDKFIY